MIIALMPVRNEACFLGLTLRALLMWVDKVVVLDHASTDGTRDILLGLCEEYQERLLIVYEPDPIWEEMRHRQHMLDTARNLGATHIVLVDADEILTGPITVIRDVIRGLPGGTLLQLPWTCLDTVDCHYSSGMWSEQMVSVAFRDQPEAHWAARNGYDFHHRQPMGVPWRAFRNMAWGLMHLQFLNKRRLKAKQYLYQLTERLRWPDREPVETVRKRYAATVEAALFAQTQACPLRWWAPYRDLMQHLDVDEHKAPWQELECQRILKEHPGIGAGLDDFGLKL